MTTSAEGGLAAELARAVDALERGARLVAATPLTGGVSADVVGLEIETTGGARCRVVYRAHRSPDFKQQGSEDLVGLEHSVLAALHRRGFAVPEPYLLVGPGDDSRSALLMEWVDGSTEVAPGEVSRALDQMAEFLAALHNLDPADLGLPLLGPIEDPVAALGGYLPESPTGAAVRGALAAGALTMNAAPSVLMHGDYWPGNVLWRHGRLAAVIDWEDAALGDPLADLATARVELLCQHGADAMEEFTASYLGYAGERVALCRPASIAIWEVYVSAAALSSMSSWGLPEAEEAHRRRLTEHFFERAAASIA